MSIKISASSVDKSSDESMSRTYEVSVPLVIYGDPDYISVKDIDDLFRETTGSLATVNGQPVKRVNEVDFEFDFLKAVDVSISNSGSKQNVYKVKVDYGPLDTKIYDRTEAALAPWERDPKWSSSKGTAERHKFFDVDGNALTFSNGQPFAAPVSTDKVMIYTVNRATTTAPWGTQAEFMNAVNNASVNITDLGINADAETLWVVDYVVNEEEYIIGETVTKYYNETISIAYLYESGDTWADLIPDMINYELKEVSGEWKAFYLKDDFNRKITEPKLGNGAGELLKQNTDNIPTSLPTGAKYPVPLSTTKSIQQRVALLEYWFKKRKSFAGLSL